jgi:RNA polymerase sigma-70 factor (ECF subfamily)
VDAPAAFRRQLLESIPRLRRYARTLTFDTAAADDLTQHTLERALQRWRQFDPRREMGVWCCRSPTTPTSMACGVMRA